MLGVLRLQAAAGSSCHPAAPCPAPSAAPAPSALLRPSPQRSTALPSTSTSSTAPCPPQHARRGRAVCAAALHHAHAAAVVPDASLGQRGLHGSAVQGHGLTTGKQPLPVDTEEAGMRWLARSVMGVYVGCGQNEEGALRELRRLGVRCCSQHKATRRFTITPPPPGTDEGKKATYSRPQLIEALALQLNPGCTSYTFKKQFSQTMAKMPPEEAARGMLWLAQGLAGAFEGMGDTAEEALRELTARGVACTCIGEQNHATKRYFSIFGKPGRFVGRPAVVHALQLQVRNRARAAKLVGGSVASTLDVNAEENEEAMGWLAGHLVQGAGGARLGDTVEQVLQELQRRRVRCVRIKKRSSNPHRFFSVGDDPQAYPGLMQTIAAIQANDPSQAAQ